MTYIPCFSLNHCQLENNNLSQGNNEFPKKCYKVKGIMISLLHIISNIAVHFEFELEIHKTFRTSFSHVYFQKFSGFGFHMCASNDVNFLFPIFNLPSFFELVSNNCLNNGLKLQEGTFLEIFFDTFFEKFF